MPIYELSCEKCKSVFDELCRFEELSKTKCPNCKSKRVKQRITCPNVSFSDPSNTSRWDSDSYREGFFADKARSDRRAAEERSHMGTNPYSEIDDINTLGEGIHDSAGEGLT